MPRTTPLTSNRRRCEAGSVSLLLERERVWRYVAHQRDVCPPSAFITWLGSRLPRKLWGKHSSLHLQALSTSGCLWVIDYLL